MEDIELERLKYRSQYLLAPQIIECPFLFKKQSLTPKYTLYSHVDLLVNTLTNQELTLVLLGDLFDYRDSNKGNPEILNDLIHYTFTELSEEIAYYSGRFVLIYIRNNQLSLLHDSIAARKIYYTNYNNEFWFSSQPHLLAKILNLRKTHNESKLQFYCSEDFHRLFNANVGNTTIYDEVFQLMPNHSISTDNFSISRYWPNKKISRLPFKEVAELCSKMITGFMESIANRYEVMLPVTAGKDSRMLLAGSRNIKDNIYFYLNKQKDIDETSADYITPKQLLEKLGLKFHLVDVDRPIDDDFKKVYFSNNPYATDSYLPHIYSYYSNFQNKVNLPGNIASAGYEIYHYKYMKVNAESLAYLNDVSDYPFAIEHYENWLKDCREVCFMTNISLVHLFYWEERLANWGTQVQLDKDIAQNDLNPFNCRKLSELFLSVPSNKIERPNFKLQKAIIKNLWPELLQVPINPGRQMKILKILNFLGLQNISQKIKYEITLRRKKNSKNRI